MGNYLTKLRSVFGTMLPQLNKSPNKKRKRAQSSSNTNTDESFHEELEEDFAESQEPVASVGDDQPGNITSGVSLNQLNRIMNRINQPQVVSANQPRRGQAQQHSITNSDFENLLFARNRLANIRSNSGATKPNRYSIMNSSAKSSSQMSKNSLVDAKLSTPARKKMKSTTQYIYTTLYLNGENSDLCVTALNKEWKLHKIYLCQSPYFDSMFKNGSRWKESSQSSIEIAIPDENINEKALFIAFGSFYKEDIEIVPTEVVNVLACASLFSLDGLIAKCSEIMIENINFKSVIGYYEASLTYGVKSVTSVTLRWLCSNLMSSSEFFLADLKLSLFDEILSFGDLLIIQVETDLYTLCKKWLYFQLSKPTNPPAKLDKNWQKTCNDFIKSFLTSEEDTSMLSEMNDTGVDEQSLIQEVGSTSLTTSTEATHLPSTSLARKECLLDRPEFFKYIKLFRKIRLQHILTDIASLNVLYSDRIIPHAWIEPHYFRNWLNTMYIDQEPLSHEFEMSKHDFNSQCARFGRALSDDTPATWRWVGFNYGIDFLISHTNRTLTLKRNTSNIYAPYKGLLSQKPTQRIYYVMKVVQLDSFGIQKWEKQTELTCLDINRNEEKFVLTIDSDVKYPVILNFRVITHPYYANNKDPGLLFSNLFS